MADNYTPQVGDRIRHTCWDSARTDLWHDVLLIDGDEMAVRDERGDHGWCNVDGSEYGGPQGGSWVKVETPEPLPERWLSFFAGGQSWRVDDHPFTCPERVIARLRVWSDESGDHAEIERL